MADIGGPVMQRCDQLVAAARDQDGLEVEAFTDKEPFRCASSTGSAKILRCAEIAWP